MRIHALQHVFFEGLGALNDWITKQAHTLSLTRLYAGELLPDLESFDLLLIMGGPMNIYDDDLYPWLAQERAFISQAIAAGKSALGICLGAQLLADALGARVYPGPKKEIGWFPIEISPAGQQGLFQGLPASALVFHWHGDTFDLPPGALHLAQSYGCINQAFLFEGRVLGLQFHLESTEETVREIITHCGDELIQGEYIQTEEQMTQVAPARFAEMHRLLEIMLSRFVA
nr:amidotransferase [uncultured Desulfobulbus sp.]